MNDVYSALCDWESEQKAAQLEDQWIWLGSEDEYDYEVAEGGLSEDEEF